MCPGRCARALPPRSVQQGQRHGAPALRGARHRLCELHVPQACLEVGQLYALAAPAGAEQVQLRCGDCGRGQRRRRTGDMGKRSCTRRLVWCREPPPCASPDRVDPLLLHPPEAALLVRHVHRPHLASLCAQGRATWNSVRPCRRRPGQRCAPQRRCMQAGHQQERRSSAGLGAEGAAAPPLPAPPCPHPPDLSATSRCPLSTSRCRVPSGGGQGGRQAERAQGSARAPGGAGGARRQRAAAGRLPHRLPCAAACAHSRHAQQGCRPPTRGPTRAIQPELAGGLAGRAQHRAAQEGRRGMAGRRGRSLACGSRARAACAGPSSPDTRAGQRRPRRPRAHLNTMWACAPQCISASTSTWSGTRTAASAAVSGCRRSGTTARDMAATRRASPTHLAGQGGAGCGAAGAYGGQGVSGCSSGLQRSAGSTGCRRVRGRSCAPPPPPLPACPHVLPPSSPRAPLQRLVGDAHLQGVEAAAGGRCMSRGRGSGGRVVGWCGKWRSPAGARVHVLRGNQAASQPASPLPPNL